MLALLFAGAQRVAALDLDSILSTSPYSPSEKETIKSIFAQTEQMHIPPAMLLPRLAEGVAKRVPFTSAAEVLRTHLRFLANARTILEAVPGGKALLEDQAAWSLTATLFESGASEQEIRALGAAAGGKARPYRSGELLYASLVGWGASRPASLQVTLAAIRSALPPDQFLGLVDIFEQGRQNRISPERIAERIVDSLPGVKTIDDLRRAVLY
jgi:hypothetical protein